MKLCSCLLFIVITLFSANTHASSIDRLEQEYGVEISYNTRQAEKYVNISDMHMVYPTSHQKSVMISLLEEFLKCYKTNVLKRNLRKIFLVGKIYLGDAEISGTYSFSNKVIVLAAWRELVYFAHHEFSSILMRVYRLDKNLWQKYNGASYTYWTNYREMKKSHEKRQLGFYYDYSQVSFEEDFNVLAGMALAKPHLTAEAIKPYSRLQGKLAIVKRFYKNIFTCSL